MSTESLVAELVSTFKAEARIVIVGASLAGLRAAEALREKGFRGSLTIIGDELHEPYDRPPLSKQVLKGWVAAEALRDGGFTGPLTLIGDEVHEPYDRPPLSKQVLEGWVAADHTKLPRTRAVDADWRLGVAATGLDRPNRQVLLANGDKVPYNRLLIATGTRARPWFNPQEAQLEGLFTLRTSDDAAKLQAALKAGPKRVLIVGSGFIGSEMASVCSSR